MDKFSYFPMCVYNILKHTILLSHVFRLLKYDFALIYLKKFLPISWILTRDELREMITDRWMNIDRKCQIL